MSTPNADKTGIRPTGPLVVRVASSIIAMLTILLSFATQFRWTEPGVVYVGPAESFWRDGTTPASAYGTIQEAIDRANPGDTILIADGTYHESLFVRRSGSKQHPVSIKAANPGGVILSSEVPLSDALSAEWTDEGDGIVSATTKWPIYRVTLGESTLFRELYGGLENLRKLVQRRTAFNAFLWESGTLYVWLNADDRSQIGNLVTHGKTAAPREWGEFRSANVTINASHIRISGLKCRMGVGASVRVVSGDDIHIENSAFTGSTYGVLAENLESERLRVTRCLYHNFPQYDWRKEWLTWDELYASYPSSTLVASSCQSTEVVECAAFHAGDGIRVSSAGSGSPEDSRIERNTIAYSTDDALEIEGPACNVSVRDNLIYECYESLGLSPVEIGPVHIANNVFVHEHGGINGAQVKLINKNGIDCGICNICITDNLFIGNWLCWMRGSVQSVRVTDNVFVVNHTTTPPWPIGLDEAGNVYQDRPLLVGNPSKLAEEIRLQLARCVHGASHWKSVLRFARQTGPSWWDWQQSPGRKLAERLDVFTHSSDSP